MSSELRPRDALPGRGSPRIFAAARKQGLESAHDSARAGGNCISAIRIEEILADVREPFDPGISLEVSSMRRQNARASKARSLPSSRRAGADARSLLVRVRLAGLSTARTPDRQNPPHPRAKPRNRT
jgi:hypothetical protein